MAKMNPPKKDGKGPDTGTEAGEAPEIPGMAWDSFDDLMDKALGVDGKKEGKQKGREDSPGQDKRIKDAG